MTSSTVDPLRATVYGPAVLATVQVQDPQAVAALAALAAPAVPRPVFAAPPAPPAPPPRARLATVGLVLAFALPPLGLLVSAVALTQILEARPRPPGEAHAVLGVAVAVIALTAALALVAG
jgi:hypothetical protein